MASRIFDASRRAAEALKHRSLSGDERKGLYQSIEGRRSIRAELDMMKHEDKRLPREKFSIEEAHRVLCENSIGRNITKINLRNKSQNTNLKSTNQNINPRSTSQNVMSSTNSEQLLFTGTL